MRKTFVLEGKVDARKLDSFICDIDINMGQNELYVYLSASIESMHIKNVLIDYISRVGTIKLILCGNIDTLCFEVFFKSNCQKLVLRGTTAKVSVYPNLVLIDRSPENMFMKKNLEGENADLTEWFKKIKPSQKLMKDFKTGQGAMFDALELNTILFNFGEELMT